MAGRAPLQWRDLPWVQTKTRHWSGAPPAKDSCRAGLLALLERGLLDLVQLGAALGDFLGRHAREVVVVLLPVAVLVPAQRRLHGRARADGALQHLERQIEGEALGVRLVRLAGRVA